MKVLHLIRHGNSLANVGKAEAERQGRAPTQLVPGGSVQMYDPACQFFDAALSGAGIEQVAQLSHKTAALLPQPTTVLCSPLSRALHTAKGGFAAGIAAGSLQLHVEPLLTEKLENSGDVGSGASALRAAHPEVGGWDEVPEVWWYVLDGAPT